jgi:hypothetical protein
MNRGDVAELHYITAIANVPSMLQHGILSHVLAGQLEHDSVAMPEIQQIRENKQIPGARSLHEYANLYFDAHNPMLSKCRARNDVICVLRVVANVLDLPGVIVTDRNAASGWARFWPAAAGLGNIDRERLFARYWTHRDNPYEEMSHKSQKCAEVLVPDRVEARYIVGAYVVNQAAQLTFQRVNAELAVQVRGDMFF